MAKKGIVASAVRVAVTAAEKAMSPSPFAKKVIAAAAAEAVRQVEQRAPEMLAPIEKKLRKNAGELARPIDKALSAEKPKRRSQKSANAKGGARKSAASRKQAKTSRGRASAARKASGRKAKTSKRR